MKRVMSLAAVLVLALVACSQHADPPTRSKAEIGVYHDLRSFAAASRKLVEIDFEDQPVFGSSTCGPQGPFCTPISNPLVLAGVTFTDLSSLATGFCSSPSCQADPDNPQAGNIVLFLYPGGTIDFPANTGGVLLDIQGNGDNPFQVRVTDATGNSGVFDGVGVSFGVAYLGFTSLVGISRIEVVSVGGTGGPLVFAAVTYGFHG